MTGALMSTVMIGIDPHKASHTAVALDGREVMLGQLRVRACVTREYPQTVETSVERIFIG